MSASIVAKLSTCARSGIVIKLAHMTTANTNTGVVPPLNIGTRCMMSRTYRDLEIQELADLTGLSRNTIRNYEKGRTTPRRPALILISFATGVDLEWLETGKTPGGDNPAGGSECAIRDLNPEPADLVLIAA